MYLGRNIFHIATEKKNLDSNWKFSRIHSNVSWKWSKQKCSIAACLHLEMKVVLINTNMRIHFLLHKRYKEQALNSYLYLIQFFQNLVL